MNDADDAARVPGQEPSMEDILSSIRRILSEDGESAGGDDDARMDDLANSAVMNTRRENTAQAEVDAPRRRLEQTRHGARLAGRERGGSQESPDGAARPRAAAPPGPQMPAPHAPALDRPARRPARRVLAALLCAARIHQEVGIGEPNG